MKKKKKSLSQDINQTNQNTAGMTDINRSIESTWRRLYESHGGGNREPANDEPGPILKIEIPEMLEKVTKDDQQLQQELKQVIMKSFWEGYYAGNNNQATKHE